MEENNTDDLSDARISSAGAASVVNGFVLDRSTRIPFSSDECLQCWRWCLDDELATTRPVVVWISTKGRMGTIAPFRPLFAVLHDAPELYGPSPDILAYCKSPECALSCIVRCGFEVRAPPFPDGRPVSATCGGTSGAVGSAFLSLKVPGVTALDAYGRPIAWPVAVGTTMGNILAMDVGRGEYLCTWEGSHMLPITRMVLVQDGTTTKPLVVSVSQESSVRVWDPVERRCVRTIVPEEMLWDLTAIPHTRRIAGVSYRNTLRVWDVDTGALVWERHLGPFKHLQSVCAPSDCEIVVYDTETFQLGVVSAHDGTLVHVTDSPHCRNGTRCLFAHETGHWVSLMDENGRLEIWKRAAR